VFKKVEQEFKGFRDFDVIYHALRFSQRQPQITRAVSGKKWSL